MEIEAARVLVYNAARLKELGGISWRHILILNWFVCMIFRFFVLFSGFWFNS